jgi:parallel beta-helix repeat protein
MGGMRLFKLLWLPPLLLLPLILFFNNCSTVKFDTVQLLTQAENPVVQGNGGVYEGKLIILHHYASGFSCEGKPQPESILIRDTAKDWSIIRNVTGKCAQVDQQAVTGVSYDEVLIQAQFEGKTYVLPKSYGVDPLENPELPDVKLIDGVCEDINGKCSLLAAIQQGSTTTSTGQAFVEVPPGSYKLTKPLQLDLYPFGENLTVRGADSKTTIIDGQSIADIFRIRGTWLSPAGVTIENLTFQNGRQSNTLDSGSAITLSDVSGVVTLDNCIFKNNGTDPAVSAPRSNRGGQLVVKRSVFSSNGGVAIYVIGTQVQVEDSTFLNNSGFGFQVGNQSSNIIIRSSTFEGNGGGIYFYKCVDCLIENTTITGNLGVGLSIFASFYAPKFDVTVNNSTIFKNAISSQSNLKVDFVLETDSNKLIFNNSVVASEDSSKPNCPTPFAGYTHSIIATNSLFDDSSCDVTGTGNIFASPQLGALINTGGLTKTFSPLSGSPLVDSGDALTCSPIDQRGFSRPVDKLGNGPRCDIGAVEVQ